MTMREIGNAMKGKARQRESDLQWQLYNSRLVSFYACAPHLGKGSGIKKPADLFELELDRTLKKQKLKKLKPIKKIFRDEQPNG
jgi:hypothetical protein